MREEHRASAGRDDKALEGFHISFAVTYRKKNCLLFLNSSFRKKVHKLTMYDRPTVHWGCWYFAHFAYGWSKIDPLLKDSNLFHNPPSAPSVKRNPFLLFWITNYTNIAKYKNQSVLTFTIRIPAGIWICLIINGGWLKTLIAYLRTRRKGRRERGRSWAVTKRRMSN
jgi:hypothetical protein